MEKIFCDKYRRTFIGAEAEKLLEEKNDNKFFQDEGVIKVDSERWGEAQFYERKTWMEDGLNLNDDRNIEHLVRFDNYNAIEKYSDNIFNIMEIGCGPFTNIRTFYKKLINLKEVTLIDPLLDQYLLHPHCFYKNERIDGLETNLFSLPFENFETEKQFDLIIINNVLEHCFDIKVIFSKIQKFLKKNGILVFSDVFYTKETINDGMSFYDAGHPLRLPMELMNQFLSNFDPIFEKNFEKLYNQDWRNDKYFIGIKK